MSGTPITIGRTCAGGGGHSNHGRAQDHLARVVNGSNEIEGVVHLHDLWRTEMI
jgi:hypothetical protein